MPKKHSCNLLWSNVIPRSKKERLSWVILYTKGFSEYIAVSIMRTKQSRKRRNPIYGIAGNRVSACGVLGVVFRDTPTQTG